MAVRVPRSAAPVDTSPAAIAVAARDGRSRAPGPDGTGGGIDGAVGAAGSLRVEQATTKATASSQNHLVVRFTFSLRRFGIVAAGAEPYCPQPLPNL
jgi:hypothetical protein